MPRSSLGAAVMRHRVMAAVPSTAWSALDERRNTNAATPDPSAASCSRFEAVVEYLPISPTTPASPAWRRHSSMASRTFASLPASTWMTRSGCSPARWSAGANRSRQRRHHSTGPSIRARMPARKMVALASSARSGPPNISCSAPVAIPPPGSCESSSLRPNAIEPCRTPAPSIRTMRARKSSRTVEWCMASGDSGNGMIRSLFVPNHLYESTGLEAALFAGLEYR